MSSKSDTSLSPLLPSFPKLTKPKRSGLSRFHLARAGKAIFNLEGPSLYAVALAKSTGRLQHEGHR